MFALTPRPLVVAMWFGLSGISSGAIADQPARSAPNVERITSANASEAQALGLVEFARSQAAPLAVVLIELESPAAFATSPASIGAATALRQAAAAHHADVTSAQDAFIARARAAGVPLLLRRKTIDAGGGRPLTLAYRLSYLMDGFIAYVPESKLAALAALPGVRSVSRPAPSSFLLDHSVNHLLGSQPTIAARRLAVYGATEELGPSGSNGNGPRTVPIDGFEGQDINIGVVDSGLNYEHPMFGGTGAGTASPQQPPAAASPTDNKKVIYRYNLGGAATLDDFGHGTHVSSTAAGYLVDGNTPMVIPTGSTSFGPTPGGVRLHGVAPQARLLSWPVCNVAGTCTGDVELAIEDAVSPVVLTGTGDGGATPLPGPIAKPVADVINLSLGGGNDPSDPAARVSNSAVLGGGVIVVAAAGNDGPEDSTVGAPCVGTLVLCVASVLDPGSVAATDVLAAGETTLDACANTNNACATPAPPAETGAASTANTPASGERVGLRSFRVAGGGELPGASVSANFVYVDRSAPTVPASVAGRVAVLYNGSGAFTAIVNPVAALNPAAILMVTDVESATAFRVVNDIPTFSISPADGAYLAGIMLTSGSPTQGAISRLPIRVAAAASLDAFVPAVSSFSSRGPNANDNAAFRTVKPDVASLGQGILAATTPAGNSDSLLGMANASGYTIANGTSMATPHIAGAAALVRQRLRTLGLDTTNLSDPDYRAKRYRASVAARAMLTNTATDLRSGLGVPDDGRAYTIQDVGAGLVAVDAALRADAIMTAPTLLYADTPDEFSLPETGNLPVPLDPDGNAIVALPTASFGNVEVIGATSPVVRERFVTIEDITGQGGGVYQLAKIDDENSDRPDFAIEFRNQAGTAAIGSVTVPAHGSATFRVRVTADGDGTLYNGVIATWYVHATHTSGKRLRMPFLYRAVNVPSPLLGLPSAPTIGAAGAPNAAGCAVDSDNAFSVDWTYTPAAGQLDPIGYRVQRGSFDREIFSDDASDPIVAGANTNWTGSEQWVTAADGASGDTAAFYIPNAAMQNESLTLNNPVQIPTSALGASLRVATSISTEAGFDFANIRVNRDGGGYRTLARLSGNMLDTSLDFDVSDFIGGALGLRLTMTSDDTNNGAGWWVDALSVRSNDYVVLAEPASTTVSASLARPTTRQYRVAGRYNVGSPAQQVVGPYGTSACVCVPVSAFPNLPQDLLFAHSFDDESDLVGSCSP